jgi:riboflavin kinase/FMN adenylyltransferase
MKILISKKTPFTRNAVCCIGSFDGVHRGHQAIIEYAKKLAGYDKKVGIMTFLPLPFFVLKSMPVICLTLREEKEKIFEQLGIDFVYYFRFTKRFARQTPDAFVNLVADRISPSIVIVGENFHFGKDREGSARILQKLAKGLFPVEILKCIKEDGTISSTRIRELLLLGYMKAANNLLGREYEISGRVVRGRGKGARLGFPTVNIHVNKKKLLPLDGVYEVKILIRGKTFRGAMFSRHDLVEIHILNFTGNLYKKEMSVKLLKRIRGIEHFPDDESLKKAIAEDVKAVGD